MVAVNTFNVALLLTGSLAQPLVDTGLDGSNPTQADKRGPGADSFVVPPFYVLTRSSPVNDADSAPIKRHLDSGPAASFADEESSRVVARYDARTVNDIRNNVATEKHAYLGSVRKKNVDKNILGNAESQLNAEKNQYRGAVKNLGVKKAEYNEAKSKVTGDESNLASAQNAYLNQKKVFDQSVGLVNKEKSQYNTAFVNNDPNIRFDKAELQATLQQERNQGNVLKMIGQEVSHDKNVYNTEKKRLDKNGIDVTRMQDQVNKKGGDVALAQGIVNVDTIQLKNAEVATKWQGDQYRTTLGRYERYNRVRSVL